MFAVFISDQTRRLFVFCALLQSSVRSQSSTNTKKEEEGGLGMAELIAIIVCTFIVFAFMMVCCIMIRNA